MYRNGHLIVPDGPGPRHRGRRAEARKICGELMPIREVAIIGAGNGGCAAAADLTLRGFNVRLYGRRPRAIAPIRERGAIELSGVLGEHVVPVAQVTNDAGAAIARRRPRDPDGADARPRGHGGGRRRRISTRGQILLAAPGHTVLLIPNLLRQHGRGDIAFCDTATLPYIVRKSGPGQHARYASRALSGLRCLSGAAHRRARRPDPAGLSDHPAGRQSAGDGVSLHQCHPPSAGDALQRRPDRGDQGRLLSLL